MFEFGGKKNIQKDRGSIGLRLMGVLVRILMDKRSKRMRLKMEMNKMRTKLFVKYVDDINVFIEAIRAGTRWIGRRKTWIERIMTVGEQWKL